MARFFRPQRYIAFFIICIFMIVCFYLYTMLEYSNLSHATEDSAIDQNDIAMLQKKLNEMEGSLQNNRKTVDEIKDTLRDLANSRDKVNWKRLQELLDTPVIKSYISAAVNTAVQGKSEAVDLSTETCSFSKLLPMKTDIQMVDVFDNLAFDNPDGGVWKQGYQITFNEEQWKKRKLKVFVVPHSHNDPGWLKTLEQYFDQETRNILNLMVEKLEQYPKMRFIYAEISYFSMWWDTINVSMRQRVKKLVAEKRLEIVTGGWVMTDEANAHYFAMIDQLIEGNQWLVNEVGVKPQSGWAIDPFGHSPTMAYILRLVGLQNMLIQRIHYSVKKHLAKNKQLEFAWRQNWDHDGRTDMFCHMMPFYSYDVPHSCGPNPAVCCQFDFKRLPGGRLNCPWKVAPVVITDGNVADRAHMLLQQYREKSQLYRNDVVLVPLGDDFRYQTGDEWDKQYQNYEKLFNHMNHQNDWNVEVQFGTLSDYFTALRERAKTDTPLLTSLKANTSVIPPGYPVLSGDFYTYADRDDHYWSGYFTSRPFYKQLDRVLESYQRAGEVLFSLALASSQHHQGSQFPHKDLMGRCVSARRHLGLFQHHDGITGTARDFVVVDYGNKLIDAMNNMKTVIATSAHYLLTEDKTKYSGSSAFVVDEKRESHDSLPEKTVIQLESSGAARSIAVFNSLAHTRTRMVRVLVSFPHVEVRDNENKVIASQIDPYISARDVSTNIYKLTFLATVPALGLVRYTVKRVEPNINPLNSFATLTLYGASSSDYGQAADIFKTKHEQSGSDTFTIENRHLIASFLIRTGMLQDVKLKESATSVKIDLGFVHYGTRPGKERSGAYLFLPDGVARPCLNGDENVVVRVVRGSIVSEVHALLPVVEQTIRLTDSPGLDGAAVEVINLVDIQLQSNYELAMRLKTDVLNPDNEFYTDLNGFQMQKRTTYSKLPLQANVYPMPSMAYVQDDHTRVSLLTGQSLGVSSLEQGWLEVMQDRRLDQDDNRGLQQPVRDNKRTPNRFRILVERRQSDKVPPRLVAGFPSLLGHMSSSDLVHQFYVLLLSADASESGLTSAYHPLPSDLPCDVDVVNLRTVPRSLEDSKRTSALILRRTAVDCSFTIDQSMAKCKLADGKISLSTLGVDTARRTSLTLLDDYGEQAVNADIVLPPMELQIYVVTLR